MSLRPYAGSALLHASLAVLGLLLAVVLSIYKPRAMTPYGQRKQDQRRNQVATEVRA